MSDLQVGSLCTGLVLKIGYPMGHKFWDVSGFIFMCVCVCETSI